MNGIVMIALCFHLGGALSSLIVGAALFVRRKGDHAHRLWGAIWVGLMTVTSVSSLFIGTSGASGGLEYLHLLSLATLAALAAGVMSLSRAIRRQGTFAIHASIFPTTYCTALLVPGAFAFAEDRLLGGLLEGMGLDVLRVAVFYGLLVLPAWPITRMMTSWKRSRT